MGPRTVDLYHFTSPQHLPRILDSGYLDTTESNISFRREHAGPDVVWLTTSPEPEAGSLGLSNLFHDKYAYRITVRLPKRDVHRWRDWARAHGSSPETITRLIGSSGGGGSGTWRVIQRRIPAAEWVEVRHTASGAVVDAALARRGFSRISTWETEDGGNCLTADIVRPGGAA